MTGELRTFQVEADEFNGGYYVIMNVTCYAGLFGDDAYPPELAAFAPGRDTKFVFALRDEQGFFLEGLEYDEAIEIAQNYEERYGDLVKEIENNANWDEWPEELNLDETDLVYHS